MLKRTLILDYVRLLPIEYLQCREEGKNVEGFQEKIDVIFSLDDNDTSKEEQAGRLLDEMFRLPITPSYKYIEPSQFDEIQALLPPQIPIKGTSIDKDKHFNKIYGAWLGRCAGCLLGIPIEGWKLANITDFLKDTDNYPINRYLSSDIAEEIRDKHKIQDQYIWYSNQPTSIKWINNVNCMPEDDDINYTVAALKIVETYGSHFTSDDIGEFWLSNIPLLRLYTAERVAYRNLSLCKYPPQSATYRNSYREWIGAQIRADFWGYIHPGNPKAAAEMAFRDASISHVKNGIYGEMFVAAMISAAGVSDNIEYIIKCGLSQIPQTSRLSEYIHLVLQYKTDILSIQEVIDKIHSHFDEQKIHHWCHTIPNAMIVCFALLYGEKDFEKSLSLAIMAAFDTDCNAATVGSILGLIIGADQLPAKWIDPLNDTLESGVNGFQSVRISSLAQRTIDVMKAL